MYKYKWGNHFEIISYFTFIPHIVFQTVMKKTIKKVNWCMTLFFNKSVNQPRLKYNFVSRQTLLAVRVECQWDEWLDCEVCQRPNLTSLVPAGSHWLTITAWYLEMQYMASVSLELCYIVEFHSWRWCYYSYQWYCEHAYTYGPVRKLVKRRSTSVLANTEYSINTQNNKTHIWTNFNSEFLSMYWYSTASNKNFWTIDVSLLYFTTHAVMSSDHSAIAVTQ